MNAEMVMVPVKMSRIERLFVSSCVAGLHFVTANFSNAMKSSYCIESDIMTSAKHALQSKVN